MKMKKTLALILTIGMTFCFVACGADNEVQAGTSNITKSSNQNEQQNPTEEFDSGSKQNQSQDEEKTHEEYVKTYFVFAEQGAVVTWFDSKTGEFKYKEKCETCGNIKNGEHGGLYLGEGQHYNAGFTCSNSKCSMWGKSQQAKIGCSVTGEYVTVYD